VPAARRARPSSRRNGLPEDEVVVGKCSPELDRGGERPGPVGTGSASRTSSPALAPTLVGAPVFSKTRIDDRRLEPSTAAASRLPAFYNLALSNGDTGTAGYRTASLYRRVRRPHLAWYRIAWSSAQRRLSLIGAVAVDPAAYRTHRPYLGDDSVAFRADSRSVGEKKRSSYYVISSVDDVRPVCASPSNARFDVALSLLECDQRRRRARFCCGTVRVCGSGPCWRRERVDVPAGAGEVSGDGHCGATDDKSISEVRDVPSPRNWRHFTTSSFGRGLVAGFGPVASGCMHRFRLSASQTRSPSNRLKIPATCLDFRC